jgi:hypothetical protein
MWQKYLKYFDAVEIIFRDLKYCYCKYCAELPSIR